jgi:mannose-6-phosphate isomerase-like protein (cupin superfamily)
MTMRKLTGNVAPDSIAHVSLAEALALLPTSDGKRSAAVFEHGTLQVKLYAPRGADAQTPHTRDEIYVVAQGNGWFVNGERRHRFATHDVIFAKAGVAHRFEDFSNDFSVWVFFYGPEGGEVDATTARPGG